MQFCADKYFYKDKEKYKNALFIIVKGAERTIMCANEINYSSYGLTTEQWNKLPEETKEVCRKNPVACNSIIKLIESGKKPEEINAGGKKSGGAATPPRTTPPVGTAVEHTTLSELDKLKPKYNISDLSDKGIRKTAEAEWKDYFAARYKENPEEAKKDVVKILYRKEVQQTAAVLEQTYKDNPVLINSKYFAEGHATPDEKKKYDLKVEGFIEEYSKEENLESAKNEYNNEYTLSRNKKNRIGKGETITEAQIRELAQKKAMMEFKVGPERITMMAENAVYNAHFNKAFMKDSEYAAEIDELKLKAETTESRKLKRHFAKEDIQRQNEITKAMQEAETEKSKELRLEAAEAKKKSDAQDIQFVKDIRKARLTGDDALAAELEKKRGEAQEKTLKTQEEQKKNIEAALDPEKKKVADELINKRMEALKAFNKELDTTLDPKIVKKIQKLETKRKEAFQKAGTEQMDARVKDVKAIAELMAEVQVEKQMAEDHFNKTVVHWGDDKTAKGAIDKKDGKNHTFLDDDMRKFVTDNPDTFGRELQEGETADFEYKGKKFKFDGDKFKNYMLHLSNDNALGNEFAEDAAYKADFYASMKDRKGLIDKRDDANYEQIKLKDRRMAGKLFKAAGIEVERDKTIAKRWEGLGKGALKGTIAAGAITLATEYLSTTKVVESKFFEIVKYSGSVPYAKLLNIQGTTQATLTGQYQGTHHVEGDQAWSQKIKLEGVATGDVSFRYQDDIFYNGSGILNGTLNGTTNGTLSGPVDVSLSGTVDVPHTSEVWYNGKLQSVINSNTPHDVTLSGQQNVTLTGPIQYQHDYSLPYNYDGSVHVDKIVTGQGSIPYKQVVDANGVYHWEADVEITDDVTLTGEVKYDQKYLHEDNVQYEGEKEVNATKRERPKVNMDNVKKMAVIGGITGAVNYAINDWGNTFDDGERKYAISRGVLADKGVDVKKVTPIVVGGDDDDDDDDTVVTPPPVTTPPPEDDDCEAKALDTSRKEGDMVATFDMKGKLLYDVIAKAYGITDSTELYDAIGVVKGWHGISQADRKKNIWISQLGLRDTLELPNGKKLKYGGVDRDKVGDVTKFDRNGTYSNYKPGEVKIITGGKVVLACDGEDGSSQVLGEYSDYALAQKVAKFYNEKKVMPTDEELEELKKQ